MSFASLLHLHSSDSGGTFFFFAPEMTKAKQGAGYSAKAADIWALGVSLYMWLYLKAPFEVYRAFLLCLL